MSEQDAKSRRKLAAILMADVSGFSRLMGSDEEGTTARMQDFHSRVKRMIDEHEGRVVDTAGDSVFGEFPSVVNAVRCAYKVQEAQFEANQGRPSDERIDTRIGVHLGDVIVEDYRVWGDGVNIAARLEQASEPGGICVSEAVYQQVHNKVDLEFRDVGVRELKNIQFPLRLYQIPPPGGSLPEPTRKTRKGRVARPRLRRLRSEQAARGGWAAELMRTPVLLMLLSAVALLTAPLYLFPTGGVFPSGGSILAGVASGIAWRRVSGLSGHLLIALGIGIAGGAFFTNWSSATNGLFLLGGLTLVVSGASRNYLQRTER